MKECGRCKQVLPVEQFNKNVRQKDGLHRDCRKCKKAYQADWYKRHREDQRIRVLEHKRKHRAISRDLVIDAKSKPCMDCGVDYPWYVMDFDHRDGATKVACVSELVGSGVSLTRILEEIAKCDVVCANCHRIRTFEGV